MTERTSIHDISPTRNPGGERRAFVIVFHNEAVAPLITSMETEKLAREIYAELLDFARSHIPTSWKTFEFHGLSVFLNSGEIAYISLVELAPTSPTVAPHHDSHGGPALAHDRHPGDMKPTPIN